MSSTVKVVLVVIVLKAALLFYFLYPASPAPVVPAPKQKPPPPPPFQKEPAVRLNSLDEEIRFQVRAGFWSVEEIIDSAMEGEELQANRKAEVREKVNAEIARLKAEQADWPAETDCDRLDKVFAALNEAGVMALQNAGYTQSDGYSDCMEALRKAPKGKRYVGYCYYHTQDLQRAMSGRGLVLSFGPLSPANEYTLGPEVGKIIKATLEQNGFQVNWDGSFNKRIEVRKIDWKKRWRD